MMASKLIELLQSLITEHGDQAIMDEYGHDLDPPEFNNDDGPCFLSGFSFNED